MKQIQQVPSLKVSLIPQYMPKKDCSWNWTIKVAKAELEQ